ncbi:hypothetical protein N7519_002994 [Penicillium mononematosum]|uniref:uncharacterized protein n=1 Tax=Penicillium mononematosum TaxID=268346 RepID=UPI00254877C4|nr:uncharacterized protein N7519_002994 [Penicillium mononematosum]KAJ6188086.1 hypothetical protein N7519_002994 [Penicillium mononematosum]
MSFSIVTAPIYVFTESTQSKTDFFSSHLQRPLDAFNIMTLVASYETITVTANLARARHIESQKILNGV